jgi:hypothetical protein
MKKQDNDRCAPGRIRDAILHVLAGSSKSLSVREIETRVAEVVGTDPTSSVRSYLRLNTPALFIREKRGVYKARHNGSHPAQRRLSQRELGETNLAR